MDLKDLQERISQLRKVRDIPLWRGFVSDLKETDLEQFNVRWLISICDTFADFGTPEEKAQAMLISTLAVMEKLFRSFADRKNVEITHSIGGGMQTCANGGDTPINWGLRLREATASSETLQDILYLVILGLFEDEQSLLSRVNRKFSKGIKKKILYPNKNKGNVLWKMLRSSLVPVTPTDSCGKDGISVSKST